MFDFATLDTLDLDTLATLKEKVAEKIKALKETEKIKTAEAKVKAAEDKAAEVARLIEAKTLTEGKDIVFMFKGAERTAKVAKITEKTFAVDLAEGKRFIKFAAFVRLA